MGLRLAASKRGVALAELVLVLSAPLLMAQQPAPNQRPTRALPERGLYVVFPFENTGASPRLDWLGEGLEELTIQYLAATGEEVYSHTGRAGELERYGLPGTARLSRATMLRIAQDLDADFVVFGSYSADGNALTIESRILRVDPPALLPAIRETAPLDSLMELHARVVWRLLSAKDKAYPLALGEFTKAQRPLRLDAFEHFIRGLLANDDEPRLRELHEAARLEPSWPDPWFALGETYAARNDCNSALPMFAKVPKTHPRYAEAIFASGVCRLQLNQPDKAEEIFVSLQGFDPAGGAKDPGPANGAPLADVPEVLNDLAVARSRQGKIAAAQENLRRAAELDPDEDDYPFNLGLLALRAGDFNAAAGYFRDAAQREPDNPDDRALLIQSLEKAGNQAEADQEREAAGEALGPNALPVVRVDGKGDGLARLDRIKNELDVAALRQEIESAGTSASTASAGTPANTAAALLRKGRQELSAGQLDSAEADFRAALRNDPGNAWAHRELADIDRRKGKLDDAIKELQASLQTRDSAVVRTMLARVYLDQKKTDLAKAEVEKALKLAPNYAEAKQLSQHLQNARPGASTP